MNGHQYVNPVNIVRYDDPPLPTEEDIDKALDEIWGK